MKCTTTTAAGAPSRMRSMKRSPNSMKRTSFRRLRIWVMWSRTDSCSRVMWWCWLSRARFMMSAQAARRSSTSTSGSMRSTLRSATAWLLTKSRPSWGMASSFCAASFICSYSSRRRTSSARGSSGSSPVSVFLTGSSMRDLISMSIAAMSRYSAASSRLWMRIWSTYDRYCRVTSAMGMSRTLKFCLRIRYSSRSSGPSNASRKISSASGGIYRSVGIWNSGSP